MLSQNNATAIHAASANGHRACVAVLLEVGGTKAKMAKNKVCPQRPPAELTAALLGSVLPACVCSSGSRR